MPGFGRIARAARTVYRVGKGAYRVARKAYRSYSARKARTTRVTRVARSIKGVAGGTDMRMVQISGVNQVLLEWAASPFSTKAVINPLQLAYDSTNFQTLLKMQYQQWKLISFRAKYTLQYIQSADISDPLIAQNIAAAGESNIYYFGPSVVWVWDRSQDYDNTTGLTASNIQIRKDYHRKQLLPGQIPSWSTFIMQGSNDNQEWLDAAYAPNADQNKHENFFCPQMFMTGETATGNSITGVISINQEYTITVQVRGSVL